MRRHWYWLIVLTYGCNTDLESADVGPCVVLSCERDDTGEWMCHRPCGGECIVSPFEKGHSCDLSGTTAR
jgi:hypothetical protein